MFNSTSILISSMVLTMGLVFNTSAEQHSKTQINVSKTIMKESTSSTKVLTSPGSNHHQQAQSSTSCTGIAACNDMIATCASEGGAVAITSNDGKTGAPDGGYCRKWK